VEGEEVKKRCELLITKNNLGSYVNSGNTVYHCLDFAFVGFAAFPSLRLEFQKFEGIH